MTTYVKTDSANNWLSKIYRWKKLCLSNYASCQSWVCIFIKLLDDRKVGSTYLNGIQEVKPIWIIIMRYANSCDYLKCYKEKTNMELTIRTFNCSKQMSTNVKIRKNNPINKPSPVQSTSSTTFRTTTLMFFKLCTLQQTSFFNCHKQSRTA